MLIGFFIASVLLALSPGPDNLYVLAESSINGARAGIFIVLGLCSGLIVHTSLVALGVAQVIQTSPVLFSALTIIGAGYLLYLAFGAWRAQVVENRSDDSASPQQSSFSYYRRGVVMNIVNPKVLLFFLAFLPQFVQPEQPVIAQIFLLGGVFAVAAFLVFALIALAASWVAERLASARTQIWLNRCAAIIFIALAVRLLAMSV